MRYLFTAIIAIRLCVSFDLAAQITFQKFFQTAGGESTDEAYFIQQTSDGGYIITGSFINWFSASPHQNIFLIKTNADGDTLWTRTFSGKFDSWGYSVRQTSDSGYIIVGMRSFENQYRFGIYLIKTKANGDTIWTRTYSKTTHTFANDIRQTDDGGYILTGQTQSGDFTSPYLLLMKLDHNGNVEWAKGVGHNLLNNASGYSVCTTTDGGFIVAGGIITDWSTWPVPWDIFLVKTNSDGDTLWTKIFANHYKTDFATEVQQTTDGGYALSAYQADPSRGLLIKTDDDGLVIWQKQFPGEDLPSAFIQTTDGGYAMAGVNLHPEGELICLSKTNSNGDLLWHNEYGVPTNNNYERVGNIMQTSDKGFIICGAASVQNQYQTAIVKTDSLGSSGCSENPIPFYPNVDSLLYYGAVLQDSSFSFSITNAPTVVHRGMSTYSSCFSDGIEPVSEETSAVTLDPNPASDEIRISFNQALNRKINFDLHDAMGKSDKAFNLENSSSLVNVSNLNAGIYFYSAKTDDRVIAVGTLIIER